MTKIFPVILSGGSGTRLWPKSRAHLPKQLLPLIGDRSLLQDTVDRLYVHESPDVAMMAPIIISNDSHRFIIAAQMQDCVQAPLVHALEPEGRNTAPAAAVAAILAEQADPGALVLLLPADHHIKNVPAFHDAIRKGIAAAKAGRIVTFGVVPHEPETGYGYIQKGEALEQAGAFGVAAFVEKPDLAKAQAFLAGGAHLWNGGMFLFSPAALLAEMDRLCPDVVAPARRSVDEARRDLDFLRLDPASFAECDGISIDYAVMEKTDKAAVVPVDMGWSDVGSWSALWSVLDKDADGNVARGDVVALETENCLIEGETALIATLGVKDLVIVETGDAVMVADKARVQDVKAIVGALSKTGRDEVRFHRRVHRPWGFYEGLHQGDRRQVKHLMVKPGASLSLQMHYHRSEHWVVVSGTAQVTIDDDIRVLSENESCYIPLGAKHRLENPGRTELHVIEVQSGSYLGEDDIVRFDDVYNRVETGEATDK